MNLAGKENDRNLGGDRKEAVSLGKYTVIIVKIVVVVVVLLALAGLILIILSKQSLLQASQHLPILLVKRSPPPSIKHPCLEPSSIDNNLSSIVTNNINKNTDNKRTQSQSTSPDQYDGLISRNHLSCSANIMQKAGSL
jgi:flagellar basal body-associated protein FliL